MQFEDFALKTNVLAFASRSKAKAKPRRRTLACSSTRTVPIGERTWTDIEPEDYSPIAYPVSKQLSTLLRHGHLPREEDGAIEFWRLKDYLRNDFVRSQHWSDEMWKSTMAKGGGNKKRFQYCTDPSGQEILYLRALQGHSGRNLIDPSLQDNVLIPNDFFEYIYHIGCAISLHSIMNSGLIPGGQNLSKDRRYSSRLWIPWNKEHRDPDIIDLEAPRLAWYKQKTWKKHQNTVYWVDIKLAQKKGFKFYQTRSNAIILYDTLPAYCIPKAIMMELEKSYTRKYMRHLDLLRRFPLKTIGWKNWVQKLLDKVKAPNQPNQNPKSNCKKRKTVLAEQSSAQEIDKRVLFDCESTNVRTGRLVDSCVPVSVERLDQDKDADENVDADQIRTGRPVESAQSIGLFTQREEIDIDFRVSGLPHAVVKQAENFRVRELVKKIESHPHREALQADLQQNNAYNPFSDESKAMIREMGNVELFELCETIPKVQCSECLLYWNQGIVYCTCGHLLRESESSQIFTNGDWMLSQSRTTSSKRSDLVVLGTAKLRHRKSISWPTMRGGDVSKRILKEFTIASNEIQHIVIRNSKLAGPRRSASRWINWHRKTIPIAHPLRSTRDIRKTGISHWTNQAEMHRWNSDQTSEKQSQLWTVSTANLEKSDLNQSLFINTKGGIRLLLLPVPHGGSGMKTGGAHNMFFFLKKIVVARSFTADGNLLQPTGCVNRTPSHVTFSRVCTHVQQCRTWHWLKV